MNTKLIVTFSVIIIYVIFCKLLLKFFAESLDQGTRFCSSDTEKFSNEFLLSEFKKSNFSQLWIDEDYDYEKYLKIYRGRPACGGLEYVSLYTVLADPYYELNRNGSIHINFQAYDHERYCLDKADDIHEGWKLMICHNDVLYLRIFHAIVVILSILLFGFTIFAYAYYKEIRNFRGKAVIGLLVATIFSYLIQSKIFLNKDDFVDILISALLMGFLQILLWITVMIVHGFVELINFKNNGKVDQKFRIYAAIEILFTILFSILIVYTHIFHRPDTEGYFVISIILTIILDIVFLIINGIKIFMLSRQMTESDQARFNNEKKWFWINVKLFVIMVITWPLQILNWHVEVSLYGFIMKDSILLLTAIVVTLILVGRKQVRELLIGKYYGKRNTEA